MCGLLRPEAPCLMGFFDAFQVNIIFSFLAGMMEGSYGEEERKDKQDVHKS